jgi:hypothetical protein
MLILFLAFLAPLVASAATIPSRDPQVVLPLLERWHEHKGFFQLEHILGRADRETIASSPSAAARRAVWWKRFTNRSTVTWNSRCPPARLTSGRWLLS